jgi:hypothetical protein
MHSSFLSPPRVRCAGVALVLTLLLGAVSTSQAYRLANRDLRAFGFSGQYRGYVRGDVNTYNSGSDGYDYRYVDQFSRERVPTGFRRTVTAPTGSNAFFLTHRPPTGNSRRMKIRAYYSGVSDNSFYGEEMVGSGSKTINVVRRGFGRPQFEMNVRDILNERSSFDGALFSTWRINGFLTK